jgi:hypothetical protein
LGDEHYEVLYLTGWHIDTVSDSFTVRDWRRCSVAENTREKGDFARELTRICAKGNWQLVLSGFADKNNCRFFIKRRIVLPFHPLCSFLSSLR